MSSPEENKEPDGFQDTQGLKHRPMLLLPYTDHDGFYGPQETDCRYISIGWAQYNPRMISVKTLRRRENSAQEGADREKKRRWSRQSEELPLHRCIDATLLIAETVAQVEGNDCIELKVGTLENQDETKQLPIWSQDRPVREEFKKKLLEDQVLKRRLKKLAETLIALDSDGAFEVADDVGQR